MGNETIHGILNTDELEVEAMEKAISLLSVQKQDLEIALSTAIEHGDFVEEQLFETNQQLKEEIDDKRRTEEMLQRLVTTIKQQKSDLEVSLLMAIEHGDAIEEQLYEINKQLNSEICEREVIEKKLKVMVSDLSHQKNDLEVLVETIASHGDEINIQMEQQISSIEVLAHSDALTNLWNRRYFDEMIDIEWNRSIRAQTPLSLLVLDIDHFKHFNDAFGHQAGDRCLKQVADAISSIPKRGGEFVARYGGEEFVVVLPICDLANAYVVAEYIRKEVEALAIVHPSSDTGNVTVSIGVASMLPQGNEDAQILFKKADDNLYQAKNTGRNKIGMDES